MATKKVTLTAETELQPDVVLEMLTKRGLIGDKSIASDKARDAQQQKNKVAYHNTQLLLKHYRTIAWMLECFPDTIAEELDQPFGELDKLIEHIDFERAYGNRKLENRLASVQKTRLMLDRVNEALTVLKKKPKDGEQLYQLIYLTYITEEKLTLVEILFRLAVSSRQYYRLRQDAINILSLRLWSAMTKEGDFWIEILSLLENKEA
jgi:hypothetical protein